MKLTEKQLKVQQRADKTLSFGCLIEKFSYWWPIIAKVINHTEPQAMADTWDYTEDRIDIRDEYDWNSTITDWEEWKDYTIIWHPMTRWRLNWLLNKKLTHEWEDMMLYIDNNPDIMIQDIFTWSEEFTDLVIAFLETLPKNIDAQ